MSEGHEGQLSFKARSEVHEVYHGGDTSYDVVVKHNPNQGTVIANLLSRKRANSLANVVLTYLNHPKEVERRRESLERMLNR